MLIEYHNDTTVEQLFISLLQGIFPFEIVNAFHHCIVLRFSSDERVCAVQSGL